MTLHHLGIAHGTDKVDHGYLPLYEKHLPDNVVRMLEIGVFQGNSLRMWREHFRNAEIHGLDVDPGCKKQRSERIHIHTGSQDDPEVLEGLIEAGPFDVVIDDGSHVNAHIIQSFIELWPHTRQLYVIEDLLCSYQDLTPHVAKWPGMKHNVGVDYRNSRADMDVFFASLIRRVDQGEMQLHFYRELAFVERT